MNKNKNLRFLIKFFVFILFISILNFKTAPASETFLEELGFQKKLNILSKAFVSSDEKKGNNRITKRITKNNFQ